MTKGEFSERLDRYLLKRERNKKLFLLSAVIFFALGFSANTSNISSILYILGAASLGNSINSWGISEEAGLLKKAAQLLSEDKNT